MIYQLKTLVLLFGVINVSSVMGAAHGQRSRGRAPNRTEKVLRRLLLPKDDEKSEGSDEPYKRLAEYIEEHTNLIFDVKSKRDGRLVATLYYSPTGEEIKTLHNEDEDTVMTRIRHIADEHNLLIPDAFFNTLEQLKLLNSIRHIADEHNLLIPDAFNTLEQLKLLNSDQLKKLLNEFYDQYHDKKFFDVQKNCIPACELNIAVVDKCATCHVNYIEVQPQFTGKNMAAWLLALIVKCQDSLKTITCEATQMTKLRKCGSLTDPERYVKDYLRPPHVYYVAKLGFKLGFNLDATTDEYATAMRDLQNGLHMMLGTKDIGEAEQWLKCNQLLGGECSCGVEHTTKMKARTKDYQEDIYTGTGKLGTANYKRQRWNRLPMKLSVEQFKDNVKELRNPEKRHTTLKIEALEANFKLHFAPN